MPVVGGNTGSLLSIVMKDFVHACTATISYLFWVFHLSNDVLL